VLLAEQVLLAEALLPDPASRLDPVAAGEP
jgi:hypothetical protein